MSIKHKLMKKDWKVISNIIITFINARERSERALGKIKENGALNRLELGVRVMEKGSIGTYQKGKGQLILILILINFVHNVEICFPPALWGFHIYTPGPVRRVKTDILVIFGRCPATCRKVPTGAGTVVLSRTGAVVLSWLLPILPAFSSDR